jgi:hypothetical protein
MTKFAEAIPQTDLDSSVCTGIRRVSRTERLSKPVDLVAVLNWLQRVHLLVKQNCQQMVKTALLDKNNGDNAGNLQKIWIYTAFWHTVWGVMKQDRGSMNGELVFLNKKRRNK